MPGDAERSDWVFCISFFEMCSICLLKEIRESLTLKVCSISCEFPEYFL